MPFEQGILTQLLQALELGRPRARPEVASRQTTRSLSQSETARLIAALHQHRVGLIRYFKCIVEHNSEIGITHDDIAEEILLKCLEQHQGLPPLNFDFSNLVQVGTQLILDKLRPKISAHFRHHFSDEISLEAFLDPLYERFRQQPIDPYLQCAWTEILVETGEQVLASHGKTPILAAIDKACERSSTEKIREILWVVANAKCSDSFAYCIVHQLRSFSRLHPDIMDIISFKILMGLPDKFVLRDQAKNNGAYRQLCSDRLKKLMSYFEECEVHLGGDHVE